MTTPPNENTSASPDTSARPLQRRSSGTLYTLRKQLPWTLADCRILSIDGGGIKGILPAAILAECEKRFTGGHSAGAFFDMLAGTSTGGIIALALGIGIPAKKILELYLEHGAEIFPPKSYSSCRWIAKAQRAYHKLKAVRAYVYDREPLKRRLKEIFEDTILGQCDRRLVVPSFDGFTEVTLFKTPHHADFKCDWKEKLVTIALATSAAPTFFSVYQNDRRLFADGGIWANNPVMNALVDILSCYELERRQVHILSLGCGDQEIEFTKSQLKSGGLWHWKEIVFSAMHLQSQNAVGQAGLLIGRDQLTRLNPASTPTPIEMDDYTRAASELPRLASDVVDLHEEELRYFFKEQRPAYRAYHGPRLDDGPL